MEGNQQKMREALVALRNRFNNNVMAYQDRYFKFSGWHWHKKAAEAAKWRDVFQELKEVCGSALSAPARQCDVGTAEEQVNRFNHFCASNYSACDVDMECCRCPLEKSRVPCEFAWAQMPYEAEEGGAK